MRPIQKCFGDYKSLSCEVCYADVLRRSVHDHMGLGISPSRDESFRKLARCCKGQCDESLRRQPAANGYVTRWEDIGDLVNPIFFLKNRLTYMNASMPNEEIYLGSASPAAPRRAPHGARQTPSRRTPSRAGLISPIRPPCCWPLGANPRVV
jgi:hypothetical protein